MKRARIFLGLTAVLAFAFLAACGGGSSSNTPAQTIAASGGNVASITVNGGPTGNYVDAGFTSVTICVPGSSTCQTIDGILVDTGSSGLRILSSVLTIPLPQQTSGGNPDVEMASEKGSSVPIQVLSDTDFTAPTSCTDNGASSDTLESLGANGIVGVGLFTQDCGGYCETVQTAAGSMNLYYECTSTTACQPIGESLAQQVPNPVSLFATDNNGVIIQLPTVSVAEQACVTGSLVFGIGTQSNNALGSATVYTATSGGNFTTTYNGTIDSASFIDSGSNGYFFASSITACPTTSNAPGFYCPSGVQNLSATNQGANGASGTVDFSIANAEVLFNTPDFAYSDLGGTYSNGAFDWGLPFFFGRNVYTGLQSSSNPNGYWAY